jgi:hypothetical protein
MHPGPCDVKECRKRRRILIIANVENLPFPTALSVVLYSIKSMFPADPDADVRKQ